MNIKKYASHTNRGRPGKSYNPRLDSEELNTQKRGCWPKITADISEEIKKAMANKGMGEMVTNHFQTTIKMVDLYRVIGGNKKVKHNYLNDEIINYYLALLSNNYSKDHKRKKNLLKMYHFSTTFFDKLERNMRHENLMRSTFYKNTMKQKKWIDIFNYDIMLMPINVLVKEATNISNQEDEEQKEGKQEENKEEKKEGKKEKDPNHWQLILVEPNKGLISGFCSLNCDMSPSLDRVQEFLKQEAMESRSDQEEWSNHHYRVNWETTQRDCPRQFDSSSCGLFILAMAEAISGNQSFLHRQEDVPYLRRKLTAEIILGRSLPRIQLNVCTRHKEGGVKRARDQD